MSSELAITPTSESDSSEAMGRAVSKFLHLVQSVTTMKCSRDCESNIV